MILDKIKINSVNAFNGLLGFTQNLILICRQIIGRVLNFIDLDIKIFTDFINIVFKIVFFSFIYVPLLTLGILAFIWVVEHLKLSYVIFIFLFWLFVQFCKFCEFIGLCGPIISFTIIVFIFAAILKIKFLVVITGVILFIRYLANHIIKDYKEY